MFVDNYIKPVEFTHAAELFPTRFLEPVFDVDAYVRVIGQRSKLEPALDDLAS
jgi:uncharacterized membrane protein